MTSIWPSAVVLVGPVIDDLDAAEVLCGFLCALVGGFEKAVAERFDDERDLHIGGLGNTAPVRDRKSCAQCQDAGHVLRVSFMSLFLPF